MIAVDTSGGRFCGNFKLIQVWHGTGFKNIGRLQKNRKKPASFWPSEDKNYAIFVATSEQDQIRKKASFPAAHVLITGAPRNDLLFRDQRSSSSLLKRLQVNPGTTIFLYAPTFRDHETAIPLSIDEINYLSRILSDINGIMLFKNHPYAKPLQIPKEAAAVRDISDESKIDLQELLLISHVLISDYSGIVTDFAITGRPMIFYWPDYAEYISNCRDFYYDMKEILPGPFAHNASRLAELMKNLDWSSEPTYREKYLAFLNHFHHYQDDQSARRLRLEVERVNF